MSGMNPCTSIDLSGMKLSTAVDGSGMKLRTSDRRFINLTHLQYKGQVYTPKICKNVCKNLQNEFLGNSHVNHCEKLSTNT